MLLSIQDLDVTYRGDDGETVVAAADVCLELDRGEVLRTGLGLLGIETPRHI